MNITDIRIRKITEGTRMKAIVSVTFDDELVVHDIKIIQGHEKLFLAMPARKHPNGEFSDTVHPTTKDLRDKLESAVLAEYERYIQGQIEE